MAASLPGDGEGLSLRAIQTAKHVEETAVRAALGRVTLAITADQDALQVKAQWKASEAKPAKAVEDHSGQGQTFQDLVSRVRVVRSSPRGFAVLLHRDAKMIQLWYEAISSESTATAEALQTLAPLPLDLEDSQEDSALRAKGLAALGLESNEHPLNPLHVPDTPNDPWNATWPHSALRLAALCHTLPHSASHSRHASLHHRVGCALENTAVCFFLQFAVLASAARESSFSGPCWTRKGRTPTNSRHGLEAGVRSEPCTAQFRCSARSALQCLLMPVRGDSQGHRPLMVVEQPMAAWIHST